MSSQDGLLKQYGIDVETYLHNAAPAVLYEQALANDRTAALADSGALIIASGKKTQKGKTLGERMSAAFEEEFSNPDFDGVGIIGSDIYPLNATYIRDGFNALAENDVVVGPAVDGGYYFLGMKRLHRSLFEGIDWGTSDVFEQTRSQIVNEGLNLHVLPELRDIDTVHDVHDSGLFKLINSKIS